ncbi:tRNA pseudouridine(55) synthase TruB [Candidatus Legionella polyplacis]|uniref:tRNA pseudouridine synthase B n=1 Tax=Candidatus Legionella polyplacis TaxID=2005262 RepID=A0ABZ2GW85_9GAMM
MYEINGILLMNKPVGLTSNYFLQKIKRIYRIKKAGYVGTLDPMASGMLPLCFGEATKFSQYIVNSKKFYQVIGLLGVKTSTSDSFGEIIRTNTISLGIKISKLIYVLNKFIGNVKQCPPMYSAVKYNGIPLYKYARKGKILNRKFRDVFISKLNLIYFDGRYFIINVYCSKGTYIRALVEDIGLCLGVDAHVVGLHRVYIDIFKKDFLVNFSDLRNKTYSELLSYLISMECAVINFPIIYLNKDEIISLYTGKILKNKNYLIEGYFRVYNKEKNIFMGLGRLSDNGDFSVKYLFKNIDL